MKFTIEKTLRGFEIVEWRDIYGKECSLQQSSLANYEQPGTSAVWLGQGDRMHLDREQVEWLVARLTSWLARGTFEEE